MAGGAGDVDGLAGLEAESRVRHVAAGLGVADFVYFPLYADRGTARKQIGDGFLICGSKGAILQVKSRGESVAGADDPESARRWAVRELGKALKQARWSRKELTRHVQVHGAVTLRPVRSAELTLERQHELDFEFSGDVTGWPLVVVLDHPNLPRFPIHLADDEFAISSRDWSGLMSALRSVAGLLTYVERCQASRGTIPQDVGDEWTRFVEICAADAGTADEGPTWGPWLSLAALQNPSAADTYQHVINRSWPAGSPLIAASAAEHRQVTEFLDQVPPSVRVSIGERWLFYIRSTAAGGQASGISLMPDKAIFLLVHHSPREPLSSTAMRNRISGIATVRAWDLAAMGLAVPLLAIGVFTHPNATDYLFVVVENPPEPDDSLRALVERDVGPLQRPQGIGTLAARRPRPG